MIQLKNNLSFSVDKDGSKIRLVVYQYDDEWVCRKETKKAMNEFLEQEEARIFKGRLQLYKYKDELTVEVKGSSVGIISVKQFSQMILLL